MQTFLPYESFSQSAAVLDNRRLGKQRVEAKQIYLALTNPSYGWQAHPAVNMWRGHADSLLTYAIAVCWEWRNRGFEDSLLPWFNQLIKPTASGHPAWLGDDRVHRSHQSNLLRKDPGYYQKYFIDVSPDLPYFWPVGINN